MVATKIKHGKAPDECVVTVHHLQWSAIKCLQCKEYVSKRDWRRVKNNKPLWKPRGL
jgi:hypothetical protein